MDEILSTPWVRYTVISVALCTGLPLVLYFFVRICAVAVLRAMYEVKRYYKEKEKHEQIK